MKRTRRWPAVVVLLLGIVLVGVLYMVPGTAFLGTTESGQSRTATCRALGPGVWGGAFNVFGEDTLATSSNFSAFVQEQQSPGESAQDHYLQVQVGVNAACNQVRQNQQAALTLAIGGLIVFVVLAQRRLRGDARPVGTNAGGDDE